MKTKYKYFEFYKDGDTWIVYNHVTDELLGHVEYYGKWEEWESILDDGVGFTQSCHTDMAHFLGQLNEDKKKGVVGVPDDIRHKNRSGDS